MSHEDFVPATSSDEDDLDNRPSTPSPTPSARRLSSRHWFSSPPTSEELSIMNIPPLPLANVDKHDVQRAMEVFSEQEKYVNTVYAHARRVRVRCHELSKKIRDLKMTETFRLQQIRCLKEKYNNLLSTSNKLHLSTTSGYWDAPTTTIEGTSSDSDDLICIICLRNRRNTIFTECSHLSLCEDCCFTLLAGDHPRCPVCRRVGPTKRIYYS